MKRTAICLAILALAGCASAPDSRGPGKVGKSEMVDGVEVWQNGVPDRPYRVIDTVHRQAANQAVTPGEQLEGVAREARARGADAVVVLDAITVVNGVSDITQRFTMAPKIDAQLIKYQ